MEVSNNLINQLEKYVLNEQNIHIFLKSYENTIESNLNKSIVKKFNNESKFNNETKYKNEIKHIVPISKPKSSIFTPVEKDTLFWCFYIIINDLIKYEMIENKNIIVEKSIKIEYVEKIRKQKNLIKQYKLSPLTKIEDNLVNNDKINIITFFTLCIIENINILFVKKNTYYELMMNDTNKLYIIYLFENGKYGFEENINNKSDNIKNSFFKINNISKPIKSISSYKSNEMIDIAQKLGINLIHTTTNKPKIKKDLYEEIIKYF